MTSTEDNASDTVVCCREEDNDAELETTIAGFEEDFFAEIDSTLLRLDNQGLLDVAFNLMTLILDQETNNGHTDVFRLLLRRWQDRPENADARARMVKGLTRLRDKPALGKSVRSTACTSTAPDAN